MPAHFQTPAIRTLPAFTDTCDIYRTGNSPPAAPDVAAVPCLLLPAWSRGQEGGERDDNNFVWTHVLLLAYDVDIRDRYEGSMVAATPQQDSVYFPDQNGTEFIVNFVERVDRNLPTDHKRAYLDRQAPTWPTNHL